MGWPTRSESYVRSFEVKMEKNMTNEQACRYRHGKQALKVSFKLVRNYGFGTQLKCSFFNDELTFSLVISGMQLFCAQKVETLCRSNFIQKVINA